MKVYGEGYRYVGPGLADAQEAAPPVAPPRLQLDAFVGRGEELGWLQTAAERHRLISVYGLAGVGKTRLLQQWCR